jgi:hypothetical protein
MLGRPPRAEPEIVHDAFFCLVQLSARAVLYGEDVPTSSVRLGALSRIYERLVLMQAGTMAPAIGPARFIMKGVVEEFVAQAQRREDFGDTRVGKHVFLAPSSLSFSTQQRLLGDNQTTKDGNL